MEIADPMHDLRSDCEQHQKIVYISVEGLVEEKAGRSTICNNIVHKMI